jgi:hypothetical protein
MPEQTIPIRPTILYRAGRGLRAPAYRLSWRWCRHSKGRRCRGAWWNFGLAISRAGDRRGGFPHSAVRYVRRFYGRGPTGLRPLGFSNENLIETKSVKALTVQ